MSFEDVQRPLLVGESILEAEESGAVVDTGANACCDRGDQEKEGEGAEENRSYGVKQGRPSSIDRHE